MDELELAFEFGKIVFKTLIEVDASKEKSGKLLRSLGGSQREEVILQKIAKYWNQQRRLDRPDGLLVVTNHRVVFLSKIKTILTTTDYLSFPIEMIEDHQATRVMFISPAIRLRVQGQDQIFTFLSNAGEVVRAIDASKRSYLKEPQQGSQDEGDAARGSPRSEPIQTLEHLKRLQDRGVITKEDFERKKREILDRL